MMSGPLTFSPLTDRVQIYGRHREFVFWVANSRPYAKAECQIQ